jgi:hypothetical protein
MVEHRLEVVDGPENRRLGGLASMADAAKGAQPSPDVATRRRDSALFPPIRTGRCPGFGLAVWAGGEVQPFVREVVGRPDPPDDCETSSKRAFRSSKSTPRARIRLEVTGGDGEHEPALRQRVERGRSLGDEKRVAIREHQDVGDEAESLRRPGDDAERHERVERVVAAVHEPAMRRRWVVGEADPVEPQILGPRGEPSARFVTSSGLWGWVTSG